MNCVLCGMDVMDAEKETGRTWTDLYAPHQAGGSCTDPVCGHCNASQFQMVKKKEVEKKKEPA